MRCENYVVTKMRIAILGSTRGTHLPALHDALKDEIKIVISNKADSGILDRARERYLEALHINAKDVSREVYDEKISQVLREHHIDLIVLIGYMRILTPAFVKQWQNKIINVHPSLLPKYAGLMDQQVHQAVLNAHETETGCSVHYVTEQVDSGPVILQKKCSVLANDTIESLKQRVQNFESTALLEAITIIRKQNASSETNP